MDLTQYIANAKLDAANAGIERWIGVDHHGFQRAVWTVSADASEQARREFEVRARALGRMNHPAFGGGWAIDLDHMIVAQSVVHGRPLSEVVMADGRFDVPSAVRFGQDLTEALIEAHSLGFTHGALSPGVILVADKRPLIMGLDPMLSVPTPDSIANDLRGTGEILRFITPTAGLGRLGTIIDRASTTNPTDRFLSAVHMYGDISDCARDLELEDDEALPWDSVGGWTLERELGRGGFGRVFLAHRGDVRVALKVLMRGTSSASSEVRRFRREAEFAAMLKSPGTIRLIEHGEDDGIFYIAFEYIDGETLSARLKRGRMSSAEVLRMYRTLLESLEEAHNLGILHRDIKPANIMIDHDGHARLLDFGIAKVQGDILAASTRLTATGNVLGTPRYICPEALLGEQVTAASDIYSLGHVMYEALVGEPAIQGSSTFHWVSRHLDANGFKLPVGPWSPALAEAIERSMEREPRDRPPTATAVRTILDRGSGVQRREPEFAAMAYDDTLDESVGFSQTKTVQSRQEHRQERPAPSSVLPSASPRLTNWHLAAAGVLLGLMVAVVTVVLLDKLEEQSETAATSAAAAETRRASALTQVSKTAPPTQQAASGSSTNSKTNGFESDEDLPSKAAVGVGGGCGTPPPFLGFGKLQTLIGLESYEWDVFVPSSYDPSTPTPTLMIFNGVGRTPRRMMKETGFPELAQQHGWVIIAVSNSTGTLTPWLSWEPEVALGALTETREKLCLDPKRLYAFGHGAGGRAAESMPCIAEMTAIATSSFRGRSRKDEICPRDAAVPYLQLSPLKDGMTPVEGGKGCGAVDKQPLAAKEKTWKKVHACKGDEREISTPPAGRCVTWDCEVPLEVCRLDGGRRWPDMDVTLTDLEKCDAAPAGFPFRDTIWEFLNRYDGDGEQE